MKFIKAGLLSISSRVLSNIDRDCAENERATWNSGSLGNNSYTI